MSYCTSTSFFANSALISLICMVILCACCQESFTLVMLMNAFFSVDVALNVDRAKVHGLIKKHVKSREACGRLYEYMRLPPLVANLPQLAGIDLWLLTCPCSWRELAWTFYRCQLPTAVIEVKKIFIEGDKDHQ